MKTPKLVSLFQDIFFTGMESFGKFYSMYRGFVYDNEDPDKEGRLKLIIPQVGGVEPFEYWAHQKDVFAGPGYGTHMLPQKFDMVWVEFEMGNPESPVWSHGYWGKNEIPKEDELTDPNSYWFITPKGNRVIVNDTKSYIKVQVKNGDNWEDLVINPDNLTITHSKEITQKTPKHITESDDIRLVAGDAIEPALLGDKTEDALNAINTTLKDLNQTLLTWMSTDGTILTGLGLTGVGTLGIGLTQVTSDIAQVTAKIALIKSQKVKLK